jgi:hypothetical protein
VNLLQGKNMLKHLFIRKYPKQTKYLFDGVTNWKQFDKKLHEVAEELLQLVGGGLSEKDRQEIIQGVLGDGFEVFVEGFIKLTEIDPRFGISNYVPVPSKDDQGVDGYGYNIRGEYSAIQNKYKSNPTKRLIANTDNLNSMVAEGLHYGIIYGEGKNYKHFVFTSAKGLHFSADAIKFRGKVKCYGINEIKTIVDNNKNFWRNFRSLLK